MDMDQNATTFTDARDGESYRTVTIGNQVWMAENLRYKCEGAVAPICLSESKSKKYGLLYFLQDFNRLAPDGWRIPSLKDWVRLFQNIHSSRSDDIGDDVVFASAGKFLKSENDWLPDDDFLCGCAPNEKADPFHFSALPTGHVQDFKLIEQWKSTSFWIANDFDFWAYRVVLYNFTNSAHIESRRNADSFACSIRCVRDYA